jgi:hypothetical protein
MTIQICRCGANDAVVAGRCLPCHRDHLAAERAAQLAREQARIDAAAARRRGRPAWRPETGDRNHGHGSELEAQRRPV